jgi:putative methionine-R-sulfoxide reductase with GAF domain
VTQTASSPQRKPLLDEASFQQLLSAAYVLQEHNDRLRGREVHADFAKNLSAIVETQKLIQTLQLDLEAAAKLVAERVQKITNASGAAIGIIEKEELVYRAGTGTAAMDAGTRIAPASSLSADCLSQGSAVNYTDTSANSQVRAKHFLEREVKSFIAVPVYHAGQVAGVLELRFTKVNAFREGDLRTAELMAGLLSEAMATAARMKWKDALASERQSMLDALQRIKPQLERLGTEPSKERGGAAKPAGARFEPPAASRAKKFAAPDAEVCSVCGSDFFDVGESFCGICGSARPAAPSASVVPREAAHQDEIDFRDKVSAPTITPYGTDNPTNGNSGISAILEQLPGAKASALPASLQELIELSAIQQDPTAHIDKHLEKRETPVAAGSHPAPRTERDVFAQAPASRAMYADQSHPTATQSSSADEFAPPVESPASASKGGESLRIVPVDLVPVNHGAPAEQLQASPWGSARKAQQWLETVKTHRGPTAKWMAHQWQARRANIYVGIAGLILLIVISGWGIRPASTASAGNASPSVSGRHPAPPAPKLTLFEKALVSLGLAEAPPAPVYLGNPDTQVWVDVHTALYHCPGSELYGKTPDGRLSTQRDAQQDQFEPANRKACP